jgi:hypothetical protein
MGKPLACTGLLHTRYLTDSGILQGMNFVTLSEPFVVGI